MRANRKIAEPVIAITRNPYEGDALLEALHLLPLENLIKPGETVVITPNWVKKAGPETGTVVGPETLRQLIQYCKEKEPGRLVIACGSGGTPTPVVFEQVGYEQIIEEEGVEFIDLNYGPYTEVDLRHNQPSRTPLNQLYEETDVLISFTQIKAHEEATVSLGLKNIALGWPPAEIHGFPKKKLGIHHDLHHFIRAMAEKMTIDLTILSGDKGMVGTGPDGGKPVDSDLIVAGTDPVAVDVIGARLLGFRPQAVYYLDQLIRLGYGEGDVQKMTFKGIPLHEAERIFSEAAWGHRIILDENKLLPLYV